MKYFCEACERLVPPLSFRMEDGLLVVKCSRCKVEMRSVPEQVGEPVPASTSKPAKASKPSKSSKPDEPVIMLGQSEAEPDPIENEPTRRVAVPAEILAAIENEARETRLKSKDSEPAKTPAPVPERTKTPAPMPVVLKPQVPEPVVTKFPAPEPVAARSPAPEPVAAKSASSRMAMSESAASNLMVLRLSEVQSRSGGESTPVPAAPEPLPPRASGVQLRVVQDPSAPSSSPSFSSSFSSDDPFMPPAGFCPKCIGVRKEGAVVCPYCGLDYARFKAEESRPSGAVASTWLGVVELWESKGAHDKVLALSSERGELAALGRLYRIRLARNPDDAMAKRGREEVLRLAAATSTFMATPAPDKRAKMRTAGLAVLFLMLMAAAVVIGAQVRRMLTAGTP